MLVSGKSTLDLIGLRVWGFSTQRRNPEHRQPLTQILTYVHMYIQCITQKKKFWCMNYTRDKSYNERRTNEVGDWFTQDEQSAINGSKVEQAWGKPIQNLEKRELEEVEDLATVPPAPVLVAKIEYLVLERLEGSLSSTWSLLEQSNCWIQNSWQYTPRSGWNITKWSCLRHNPERITFCNFYHCLICIYLWGRKVARVDK